MTNAAVSEPRCVWNLGARLGEGPVWVENALWFVDIKGPSVHRYCPQTGARDTWPMPESIGCLTPSGDGDFLAGLKSSIARLRLGKPGDAPEIDRIATPLAGTPGSRFNDGKAAPDGSFWLGSMDDSETKDDGAWWRIDQDGGITQLDTGFRVTNGPAFDPEIGRVYVTDSARRTIFVADWRPTSDRLDKTVWRRFEETEGYPDGMTVDARGDLWVAFWDGSCIRRFDRDGAVLEEMQLPVPRPTSVALGGDDSATLFVTSASIGLTPERVREAPMSGGLFAVTLRS
ncbi:MAG: SMP-30/gluconolactonase/LRE family protein [Maricaulaceae bacterium]|jgi:sugar lactone lactonase YvrE